MPACFSRAPVTRPAKPAADERDLDLVGQGLALDRRDVRIVDVVGEPPGGLDVLLVAVGPQALVALGSVAAAQRIAIDRFGGGHLVLPVVPWSPVPPGRLPIVMHPPEFRPS